MWIFGWKGLSGFLASPTAEQVTHGIDGTCLTAIVTGASSGIGAETARVLALRGVHVVIAVRNVEAGQDVKKAITKDIPKAKIDVMQLDLSSMASVRKFASEYLSRGLPLNILINNAGIFATPFTLSQDNIELQFATNHIGHFLLTELLLDTMKKTARESNHEGRIVNVSSTGHRFTYHEGIRFNKINDKSEYNRFAAYGQSKLANILHANELARHLKILMPYSNKFHWKCFQFHFKVPITISRVLEDRVDITANSVHPGAVATNIPKINNVIFAILRPVAECFIKNIAQGAATTCYVALNPQVKGVSGEYFMDCNIAKPTSQAKDAELAKRLWDFSVSLTNPD